ncbi:MAG: tetratricopeptide repeat protein [SAR324 cluster bacterium]|nr:tetratricopeptide repeat protein [SAR324 cluster bacterium]
MSQAKTHWDQAQHLLSQNLFNHAILSLREAIALEGSYLERAMGLMASFTQSNQPEKAIATGLAVLGKTPENTELMNQVGNQYRQLGMYSKAVKMYRNVLKLNPRHQYARYNLAACTFNIKAADENLLAQTTPLLKLRCFRKIGYQQAYDELVPAFYEEPVLETDADLKKNEGHPEDAQDIELWLNDFEQRAKAEPENWKNQFDLAVLYDVGRFGKLAIKYYKNALLLKPDLPEISNNLAVAMASYTENLAEAKALLLTLLKNHRTYRPAVLNLAIVYRRLKQPFASLKYLVYLGDLLQKSRGQFDFNHVRKNADDLYQTAQYVMALPLYQVLIEEENKPEWHYRLGLIYYKQKQTEKGIRCWLKTLELQPDHPHARNQLEQHVYRLEQEAQILMDDHFMQDAVLLLKKATDCYPLASTWELLAEAYEALGEEQNADECARIFQKMTEIS